MAEHAYDDRSGNGLPTTTRAGPTLYALVGVLVGIVLGFLIAWVVGGNPLSDANEVEFVQLTVASVSEEGDRLCWAEDPDRRDSPLQCAILALDPAVEPPGEGTRVTAGLVRVDAPDGTELRQVIHVGPEQPHEASEGEGDS
jgi:hypothetical protein